MTNKKKLSSSPSRHTFLVDCYVKRCKSEGIEPDEEYLKMLRPSTSDDSHPGEYKKPNLEHDLRSTEWILNKVRSSKVYSQNLYAAMCNNDFQKNEAWVILKNERWHCSWRYAGGIIADMREEGDYIDWYCSGINEQYNDETYNSLSKLEQDTYLERVSFYVSEGDVVDEIREDLLKLGWTIIPYED